MQIYTIRYLIPTILLVICCFVFEKRFRVVWPLEKKMRALKRAGKPIPKNMIPMEKDYRTVATLIGALAGFLLSTLKAVTVYEGTIYGAFIGMVIGMLCKRDMSQYEEYMPDTDKEE
ncbi:MAG: hypothetical protein PUC44_04560 [Eubacteriales bacterium]|nr:hypothetical protein [Eubacteriales bacterium]